MILWRLTREKYQTLDGEGARLNGGRWNSEGIAVVYLSRSLSLAALEYLVHIDPADAPTDLVALEVELPDDASIEKVTVQSLPDDWYSIADHPACIERGNLWATQGKSLLLQVPSAVVHVESNMLMNPRHPEAVSVRVVRSEPFLFDPRLLP